MVDVQNFTFAMLRPQKNADSKWLAHLVTLGELPLFEPLHPLLGHGLHVGLPGLDGVGQQLKALLLQLPDLLLAVLPLPQLPRLHHRLALRQPGRVVQRRQRSLEGPLLSQLVDVVELRETHGQPVPKLELLQGQNLRHIRVVFVHQRPLLVGCYVWEDVVGLVGQSLGLRLSVDGLDTNSAGLGGLGLAVVVILAGQLGRPVAGQLHGYGAHGPEKGPLEVFVAVRAGHGLLARHVCPLVRRELGLDVLAVHMLRDVVVRLEPGEQTRQP
eukprot:scaffold10119_cov42-Prasinocladus_malaysianus.AAC.1